MGVWSVDGGLQSVGYFGKVEVSVLGMETKLGVQVPCGAAEGNHELKATA